MCPVDEEEVSHGLAANGSSGLQRFLCEIARCRMIARSVRKTLSASTLGDSALEIQ
jgi:hypothetical protein